MRRAEGLFRNVMPAPALVIHGYLTRLANARVALINWNSGAGTRSVETLDDLCFLCGRTQPVATPGAGTSQLPLPCPCCGICVHPSCATSAVRRLVKDAEVAPGDPDSDGSDDDDDRSNRSKDTSSDEEADDPETIAALLLSHLNAGSLDARASASLASCVAADGALPLLCATCRCVIPSL